MKAIALSELDNSLGSDMSRSNKEAPLEQKCSI